MRKGEGVLGAVGLVALAAVGLCGLVLAQDVARPVSLRPAAAAPIGTLSQSTLPDAVMAPVRRLFNDTPGETRVLLVEQGGRLIFADYKTGFDSRTRFVSWSMAKSVTATAIGILVDEGRLRLDDPAPVPAWRAGDDPRGKITIRHLLNMSSGLQHQEGSEGGKPIHTADTVRLLFTDGAQDTAAYAASRPLAHPPGTHWQYSTATTHILAEIVANAITAAKEPSQRRRDTVAWFKGRLWDPLGITTAEWDFDARGLFLGGSLLHMTAADYLRLGRLYLDRGLAPDGRRIVSETWLAAALAKAPAANNNQYAGQFWLNTGPSPTQQPVLFHPAGGADTFAMLGHLGQYVIVVPSKRAVIVRLGKTANADRGPVRTELGRLIDALQAVP